MRWFIGLVLSSQPSPACQRGWRCWPCVSSAGTAWDAHTAGDARSCCLGIAAEQRAAAAFMVLGCASAASALGMGTNSKWTA